VKNVERPRKADANPKSVLNVPKQELCRNRRKRNLPAAAAPVKNNLILTAPAVIDGRGFFYVFLTDAEVCPSPSNQPSACIHPGDTCSRCFTPAPQCILRGYCMQPNRLQTDSWKQQILPGGSERMQLCN
jgi:hypothetical protein